MSIPHGEVTGIELTQRALTAQVGEWGGIFVAVAIFFFAFTSIIANYSLNAETNLIFPWAQQQEGPSAVPYRCSAWLCSVLSRHWPTVWALADVSMGLMAIVNLARLSCYRVSIKLAKDYNRQLDAYHVRCGWFPELKLNWKMIFKHQIRRSNLVGVIHHPS